MAAKKILIAEDDEAIRKIIKKELENNHFEVFEAVDGEHALGIMLNQRPDLLLLDVIMPRMHGMELLRKLREEEWGKQVPVILLTNFAEDPKVIEAVKAGHCELMAKAESRLEDVVKKIKQRLS